VLRDACGRVLPGYMVPAMAILDRLPLTASGKLDRRALPVPEYTTGSEAFQSPTTARERALCELFAQVLGVDRVGVEDSFFDLGGHSLLAAVLVARLTKQMGTKLSLKAFMGHPTVRAIDRYLAPSQHLCRKFQFLGVHPTIASWRDAKVRVSSSPGRGR
jgi:acyl carrier protein